MFKELEIDFEIPDELQRSIDQLIEYLNSGRNPDYDDCERTVIYYDLRWCKRDELLTEEQVDLLMDYYVKGGIHKDGQSN